MKSEQFRTVWPIMFALTVAVGTGLAALLSIDFTGVDYRQHPIATIVGTLLPSVIGGVIAYFIAPRIFPKFRLHLMSALRARDARDKIAMLTGVTSVASFVILVVILSQFEPRILGEIKPSASPSKIGLTLSTIRMMPIMQPKRRSASNALQKR